MAAATSGIKCKDFRYDDLCLETERSNVPDFKYHATLILESKMSGKIDLMGIILRKILDDGPISNLVVIDGEYDEEELKLKRIFNIGGHEQRRTVIIRSHKIPKHQHFDYIVTTDETIAINYVRRHFPPQYIEPNIAAIQRTLKLNNEVYINTKTRYIGDLWTFYKFT